jgi:serine kinase of HPr protein (carbohydrate metabolism regulator)
MIVNDIVKKLGLKVFNKNADLSLEVKGGFVGDLLSHVMGNSEDGEVWLTVQTHKNVLAIASLNDLSAIVLIDNQQPDPKMLEAAEEEEIPVLGSDKSAFELGGKLFELLEIGY